MEPNSSKIPTADVLLPDEEGVTSSNRVTPSYMKTEVKLQRQEASRRQYQNDGVLFSDSGLFQAPLGRIRPKSQADGIFLRDSKKVGYKNKEGSAESQPMLTRTSLRGKEKVKRTCPSDSEESQPLMKRTCLRDKEKVMIRNSKDYGIDFNDLAHPVKPFKCVCGSPICRGSDCKAQP